MGHPEIPGERRPISMAIRADIVYKLDENFEQVMQSAQLHMMDAIATVLVMHQRFECIRCLNNRLLQDFFPWLNETGYVHIIKDFDYSVFMREVVTWAYNWAIEQTQHPCTDGMNSSRAH